MKPSYRRKPRLLIIGPTNGGRTQMAEAYVRNMVGERLDVQSAGMSSGSLDPRVHKVMAEDNITLAGQGVKLISADALNWADLIITIDDGTDVARPPVPQTAVEKRWSIDNPVTNAVDQFDLNPFRDVRDEIKRRVKQLTLSMQLISR